MVSRETKTIKFNLIKEEIIMKKNYRVFYSSEKREVVYEVEPSRMRRGKMLVARNSSFEDLCYMSKKEAEEFMEEHKASGFIEAEL